MCLVPLPCGFILGAYLPVFLRWRVIFPFEGVLHA